MIFVHVRVKIDKIDSNIENNFINFDKYHDVSTISDWILMIYDSLDSSHQDASNRSVFMSLGSMDQKLFAFYCLETFAHNFCSIDPRDMKTLRLYAFCQDESNEPLIVKF